MADREIVTKIVVTSAGVGQATDAAATGLKKVKDAAGETARVVDQLGSTSTARLKARLDTLSASFDSVSAAEHKFAQETLRTQKLVNEGIIRGLRTEEEAARVMSNLRKRQIEEINRLKEAKLASAAVNDNSRQQRAAGVNVAYQFQDITMMAAAGQNPMMTALQQGSQLAGIFASVDAKGGSMFKTLIGGFTSLVSWQAVVAVGLVGLTTAVIQYGMEWFNATDDAAESLKKSNDLIKAATAAWGDQLPAVKKVTDELERQEKIQTGLAGIAEMNRREAEKQAAIADVSNVRGAFGAAQADITALVDEDKAREINATLIEYVRLLELGDANLRDYAKAMDAVNSIRNPSEIILQMKQALADSQPVVKATTDAIGENNSQMALVNEVYDKWLVTLRDVPPALGGVVKAIQELNGLDLNSLTPFGLLLSGGPPSNITGSENTFGGDITRMQRLQEQYRLRNLTEIYSDPFNAPLPDMSSGVERDVQRDEFHEKAAAAAKKEADALERLRKENQRLADAEQKRIDATNDFLQGQADKQAASELELQTFGMEEDARTRLLAQLEAEQELRKTNVDLTQAQADAYRAAAAATAENKIALTQLRENQDALNDAQSFFVDQGKDLFGSLIEGGEKFSDVLKRIALNLADAVLQAVLLGQGPLAGIFGSKPAEGFNVGGLIGTLLGNTAKGGSAGGPTGGTVAAATNLPGVLSGSMAQYAGAIRAIESSGNYQALGPIQRSGDRALGAYQVMGANLPSWSKMSFGRNIGQQEFLGSQSIQDKIFADRFGSSIMKYGNPQDAASVWFTGRPTSAGRNAMDSLGTTGGGYVEKFNSALAKLGGTTTQVAQSQVQLTQATQGATGGLGQLGSVLGQVGAGGAGGAGGGINWLSTILGAFGGSAIGGGGFTTSLATGWATRIALGGAFYGGNVIPFSRGGIVGSPTLFPMANGAGLMGEAGPEAVMPLRRGSDGRLGVSMRGGGTGVTIHNYSNAEVKVRETPEGKGFEVVLEERTADRINTRGSPLNKAVRNAAGRGLKRR